MAPNDPPLDTSIRIRRLSSADARSIVACFQRVYADSYANEIFYQPDTLAEHIHNKKLYAVGAFRNDRLVGHMAMTIPHPGCQSAELGNTVVDPDIRGGGVAWQVGDELIRWCREAGFTGFLHYPTTDHHIMQRQSVKAGFETGLMLGYIPAETHGKVSAAPNAQRPAATVVYQPLAPAAAATLYCPAAYVELLNTLAPPTGLIRHWQLAAPQLAPTATSTETPKLQEFAKRGLQRLTVAAFNAEATAVLETFLALTPTPAFPCQHLDLYMSDPNIGQACDSAARAGFAFCAWLPGFAPTDILRLQRVDRVVTDSRPRVVNPVAQRLLEIVSPGPA